MSPQATAVPSRRSPPTVTGRPTNPVVPTGTSRGASLRRAVETRNLRPASADVGPGRAVVPSCATSASAVAAHARAARRDPPARHIRSRLAALPGPVPRSRQGPPRHGERHAYGACSQNTQPSLYSRTVDGWQTRSPDRSQLVTHAARSTTRCGQLGRAGVTIRPR